jgi:hypothetical protein
VLVEWMAGRRLRQSVYAAALAAVLFSALVASLRAAGPSPIAWVDTFNDENEVQRCLVHDSCTMTGVSTSVPGQVHSVAWLELRTLLAWMGVGLGGAHLAIQLLNALAAVLVFHLATQLGGALAGVVSVWILLDGIDALLRVTALYNSSALLFLGAVFVLACTAAVERPGFRAVALVALVAAVMANVHLACVLTGASVLWVAVLAPRRRLLLAAFGALLFGLAAFALAPPTWVHNLSSLLQHPAGHPNPAASAAHNPTLLWSLFAVCAWLASAVVRAPAWREYRRRAQGAMAVMVPFLAAFLIAPRFGLYPEPKYMLHVKAACAIAAALPLALLVGTALRAVSHRLRSAVESAVPFALAALLVMPGSLRGSANGVGSDDERTPTVEDVTAVARILRDEQGWDVARVVERLKTPHGVTVLIGVRQALEAARQGPTADATGERPAGTSDGAILMRIGMPAVPDPPPSNWRVVRRSERMATVLVLTESPLDWSSFELCVRTAEAAEWTCTETGWRFDTIGRIFVPGMPPPGLGWRGTIRMSVPLRPTPPGDGAAIFMPRLRSICGGRVVSRPGGRLRVDADGRRATVEAQADQTVSSGITLEWDVGSPECEVSAYDGVVPFVVEGNAESVRRVESILHRNES